MHTGWEGGAGITPLTNYIYLRPNTCQIKRKVLSSGGGFGNDVLNRASVRLCQGRGSVGPLAASWGFRSDPGVNAMWKSSTTKL